MFTLKMKGITRSFPGVLACDNIDLELHDGEVLALLGENGAGKTTLMNILYGLYQPDKGQILINGEPVKIGNPYHALSLGIGMVHQHFMLVPNLTVLENAALGWNSKNTFKLNLSDVRKKIVEISDQQNLNINPDAYIWQLSVGEQQRAELIKALTLGAKILILDEPTAALTPQETEELLALVRRMGCPTIFISHKLNEVRSVSDRVLVLRGGKKVFDGPTSSLTDGELAERMAGRELGKPIIRTAHDFSKANKVLKLRNISAEGDMNVHALLDISLDVMAGEIVGIAGVSGSGQKELAEVVYGLREATQGHVFLGDTDVTEFSVYKRIHSGIGYIPENRLNEGTIPTFSVQENLILKDYNSNELSSQGFLKLRKIRKFARELAEMFDIRTPSLDTHCAALSGGNIQKVILAREIPPQPKLLIATYPIRGLDLGAAENVHKWILKISESGAGVLLISEELDELLSMCDRIAVLYEGKIMKVLSARDTDKKELGLLMAGISGGKK